MRRKEVSPGRPVACSPWSIGMPRASGSRPSGARRTRSTPTRSSHRSSPTASSRPSAPTTPTSSWSTPARSSRPPAASRSRRSSTSPTPARPGARLVVTGCLAERSGAELAAAMPEVDAVVGLRGRGIAADLVAADRRGVPSGSRAASPSASATCWSCPRAAPSAPWAYVKVAEGCDRACAVLRDPVVPRQAAVAHPGLRRRRGPRPRRDGASRSSCSWPRTSPGTAATPASRDRSRRCCAASTPSWRRRASPGSASSTSTRARSATRSSSTMLELADRRALLRPLAPARRPRAARADEALGERRALPRRCIDGDPGARSPTPRSGRRSSSGSPARPRPRTRSSSRSSTPSQLDWAGFFPFSAEDGTPAATMDGARRTRRSSRERLRECEEVQAPITQAARDALGARRRRARGARRRCRRRHRRPHRPDPPRGARDRRRRAPRRRATPGPASCVRARAVAALGPDLVAEPDHSRWPAR